MKTQKQHWMFGRRSNAAFLKIRSVWHDLEVEAPSAWGDPRSKDNPDGCHVWLWVFFEVLLITVNLLALAALCALCGLSACWPRRCMMTIFEGFEVRAGVARQQQQPLNLKAEKVEEQEAKVDYSKEFKEPRAFISFHIHRIHRTRGFEMCLDFTRSEVFGYELWLIGFDPSFGTSRPFTLLVEYVLGGKQLFRRCLDCYL